MRPLSSIATSCGYQVITSGITFCEITGDGRWHVFEHECYRYVKHSLKDHVTIIVRDPLGGRELRDLGEKGERRAELPSNHCKWERHEEGLHGVKVSGRRWTARIMDHGKCVYIGTFDDAISAGMAHDRYALEHGMENKLNFPHMKELVKQELAGAVAD